MRVLWLVQYTVQQYLREYANGFIYSFASRINSRQQYVSRRPIALRSLNISLPRAGLFLWLAPVMQGALTSQREAEDARETLAAALARANARIAELTSKAAQLTRYVRRCLSPLSSTAVAIAVYI